MEKTGKLKKSCGRAGCRLLAWGLVMCGMAGLLTGCGGPVDEEDSGVKINHSSGKNPYIMTEAVMGEVVLTEVVQFRYGGKDSTNVMCEIGNKNVYSILVEVNDIVEEGQKLVIFEGGDRTEEIRELEYQIERNRLQLSYVDINEENAVSSRWWRFVYQSNGSEAEEERLEDDLAKLRQTYRYQREDLQDKIDLQEQQLNRYRKEEEEGCIVAPISGVVTYVNRNWESRATNKGELAFMIADNSNGMFESTRIDMADYFPEGEVFDMYANTGVTYSVIAYNRDAWDTSMYLVPLKEEDIGDFGRGSSGIITLTMDRKENVLTIPKGAVQTVEGKSCVYVLDENNIRSIKWIETGLYGDTTVEVVSGLEEGEEIVLR